MHVYETVHPVAHSADDMFALVANVESYPSFLPVCEALTVRRRQQESDKEVLIATMTIGYKLLRESFTTQVILDRAQRTILVKYLDGPFAFLENRWRFLPLGAAACEVDFYIAYSFRSRVLERLMARLFSKAVQKYTGAFEARADAIYGFARPRAVAGLSQH
jgi:coenzyme Q-binding protein COQ10